MGWSVPSSDWRYSVWRHRSKWEHERFRLHTSYIGGDFDDPPRVRLLSKRLHQRRKLAFMPARYIHAPAHGLRKRRR